MKKGFTLIELIISIAIIAIVSTILIPHFAQSYESSKEDIISIVNNETTTVIMRGEEVLGYNLDLSEYEILDIDYKDQVIYIYVE